MRMFGHALSEETSPGPNGPLVSFNFEIEDAILCIGEDQDGEWFGFIQIAESEIKAFGKSAQEVRSALIREATLVRVVLQRLLAEEV